MTDTWKIKDLSRTHGAYYIETDKEEIAYVPSGKDNAEKIVKSVNMHDELVKALDNVIKITYSITDASKAQITDFAKLKEATNTLLKAL